MSTIIIPLTNFDVDLSQVAEIALRFSSSGSCFMICSLATLITAER